MGIRPRRTNTSLESLRRAVKFQPTFSMFPDGWAGLGLLLLRVTAAACLAWCGYVQLARQDPTLVAVLMATTGLASGFGLLLGYLMRLAAVFGVVASVGQAFGWPQSSGPMIWEARVSSVFAGIIAIALLCLGPGAFSLDALRHGHREIIIPQKPKNPLEE